MLLIIGMLSSINGDVNKYVLPRPSRRVPYDEPEGYFVVEKFRKLVSFQVALELRDIANAEFWTEWTDERQ